MTIGSNGKESLNTAQDLALGALGWILSDSDRAGRFLALTGLTPNQLREGLEDPTILAAVLNFLCSHEPDLLAAADSMGIEPEKIALARRSLEE